LITEAKQMSDHETFSYEGKIFYENSNDQDTIFCGLEKLKNKTFLSIYVTIIVYLDEIKMAFIEIKATCRSF